MFYMGEAFGEVNATVELSEDVALDLAGDLDVVNLFDAVSRVRKAVGQLAIIREKNEAFGREVEPTDAKHARYIRRHEVDYARSAGRIASCRYDTRRLIDGEVGHSWPRQHFTIDTNLLCQRIDAGAELCHYFVIDFNAPFSNKFFALTPAGEASLRENLLQAVARLGAFVRAVFGACLRFLCAPWARRAVAR